jgi:hypothetical protein
MTLYKRACTCTCKIQSCQIFTAHTLLSLPRFPPLFGSLFFHLIIPPRIFTARTLTSPSPILPLPPFLPPPSGTPRQHSSHRCMY